MNLHLSITRPARGSFLLAMGLSCLALAPSASATPPFIVSLNSVTNHRIGLCFSEPVTLPSAINLINYAVDAGLVSVTNIVLRPDSQSVELFLNSAVDDLFSVAVTNVANLGAELAADAKTGFMSAYASTSIGAPGDPNPAGDVYSCFHDSFEVTVGGSGFGGTNDYFHFVSQAVVGDFDVRVRVTRLDLADPLSQAGLMARESLAADSRTLQTFFTPALGSNQIEVAVRSSPGAVARDIDFQVGPRASADPLRWQRITRSNDVFTTYHATNGVDWLVSGITTQAFNPTLLVGLAVSSHTNGQATTAAFTDIHLEGVRPGDDLLPTLTATLSTTNLQLSWLAVPRDYAVETATNLTDWSLHLLPIQRGSGPTERIMLVPMEPGVSQLFARLTRVEKVFVVNQAKSITPGIILSPENGLRTTNYAGSLCSFPVQTGSVFSQSATALTIPVSSTRFIDTVPSDTSVNTVLQVRNTGLATACNDDAINLGTKSKVKPLPGSSSTSFKILVGARAGTSPSATIRVGINY
jgi:regulation of enolase protein 1 (concanavalin A-like superfamily)